MQENILCPLEREKLSPIPPLCRVFTCIQMTFPLSSHCPSPPRGSLPDDISFQAHFSINFLSASLAAIYLFFHLWDWTRPGDGDDGGNLISSAGRRMPATRKKSIENRSQFARLITSKFPRVPPPLHS